MVRSTATPLQLYFLAPRMGRSPVLIVSTQSPETIRPKGYFGFIVIADARLWTAPSLSLWASAPPSSSGFPLTSRSWNSQVQTLILTCGIETEPGQTRRSPPSNVHLARQPMCSPQSPTSSIQSGQCHFWRLMVPFRTMTFDCSSSLR